MKKILTISMKIGRYLVHNTSVELNIVGGPYITQKAFEAGLMDFLGSNDYDSEDDTMHILSIGIDGGIGFSEFSGGFMDKMREKAGV